MATTESIRNVFHGLMPVLLMVLNQTTVAAVNILFKLSVNAGANLPILVAYRIIFSVVIIVPIAFYMERNRRANLTRMILVQAFVCGLFGGSLLLNIAMKALSLTSATFVSAIYILVPAITFVITVCLRIENLQWNTSAGRAKMMGTILGIGGAMLLIFYKGVNIHLWNTNVDLLHGQHFVATTSKGDQHSNGFNKIIGSLLAIGSCMCYSAWLIIQANMVKRTPCPYSVTALASTFGAVQAVIYALCIERKWNEWKLGWNINLLTAIFSGSIGSGLMFIVVAWCVEKKGPLFVSAFTPLMLIIVAIAGSLFLNESLYIGTVLGAICIIFGLYALLWGKRKEEKMLERASTEVNRELERVI